MQLNLLEPGRSMTRFLTSVLACLLRVSDPSDSESDRFLTLPELEPAGVLWALLRAGKAGRTRPAAEPERPGGVPDTPCLEVTGTDISEMETLTGELPLLLTSALVSVPECDGWGMS